MGFDFQIFMLDSVLLRTLPQPSRGILEDNACFSAGERIRFQWNDGWQLFERWSG
jgi:hypothetical protein